MKDAKGIAENFVAELKGIYGDSLVSAALYGSAASGEHAGKNSNINLVVVLDDTSIPSINKASALARKSKYKFVNIIFFTEHYIKSSADVFPIEFLDIKENHVMLYGKDVFKDLEVDVKNLRFQCEQELKSRVLNIKKAYLRTGDAAYLREILFKSLTSALHILRNLVRLKGKKPSYKKEAVIGEAGAEFSIDVTSLERVLDAKNRNLKLKRGELDELFSRFVGTLEAISDKVDRL